MPKLIIKAILIYCLNVSNLSQTFFRYFLINQLSYPTQRIKNLFLKFSSNRIVENRVSRNESNPRWLDLMKFVACCIFYFLLIVTLKSIIYHRIHFNLFSIFTIIINNLYNSTIYCFLFKINFPKIKFLLFFYFMLI